MRKVSHSVGVRYDPDVHRSSTLHAASIIEQVHNKVLTHLFMFFYQSLPVCLSIGWSNGLTVWLSA